MPSNKCTKQLIEQVRVLRQKNLPWRDVAKAVDVGKTALLEYKNPESDSYNKDFAEMVEEAAEALADKTKAGQFEQSVKHKLKRGTYEFRTVDVRSLDSAEKKKAHIKSVEKNEGRTMAKMSPPPVMPPSWFSKGYLIDYAYQVLDLELHPKGTIPEMRAECQMRVKELTVTVRVKIREDEVETDPNQAAVQNVLKNTGREDDRWSFDQAHVLDTSDPLTKLLKDIAAVADPLPRDELKDDRN